MLAEVSPTKYIVQQPSQIVIHLLIGRLARLWPNVGRHSENRLKKSLQQQMPLHHSRRAKELSELGIIILAVKDVGGTCHITELTQADTHGEHMLHKMCLQHHQGAYGTGDINGLAIGQVHLLPFSWSEEFLERFFCAGCQYVRGVGVKFHLHLVQIQTDAAIGMMLQEVSLFLQILCDGL